MYFSILVGLVSIMLLWFWRFSKRTKLHDVPGRTFSPFWNIWSPPDASKVHTFFYDLSREYGKIMKIPFVDGNDLLILSGIEAIYQVSVTEGKKFGGRFKSFRTDHIGSSTGILLSDKPDATWKSLRKTSQRHLRQFGDGLSRLETIILDIAEDMFSTFDDTKGKPFDPRQVVFETGLNSIAFLIIGKRAKTGDIAVEKMREYERMFLEVLSFKLSYLIHDGIPWLRHLSFLPGCKGFERTLQLESEIWKIANDYANDHPETESICKVLREHIAEGDSNMTEIDAIKATLSLLTAGVTTTSNTFYGAINILAHHPDVQSKLFKEIERIAEEKGRDPNLQDRPEMPYARACLLEILRLTTVVPLGVGHQSMEDGVIGGYKIPAGTRIVLNLWTLHHDEDFWDEPHSFRPQRFLTEEGDVIPADHPNRKHLMPFGAGTRVCLGESLALTRLFLWIITLVQRFRVIPHEGNEKSSIDSRLSYAEGVLKPLSYKVIFEPRE